MSYEKSYDTVKETKTELVINNLLGGIAWGVGVTLGATILLAIFGFFLAKLNTVPLVGNYVAEITKYVNEQTENMQR